MTFKLNRLTTIILLLLILLGVGWFLSRSPYNLKELKKINQAPVWYMTNVTITKTNEQGKVKGILTSDRLTHHQAQNVTDMKNPFIITYDDNNVPWHITSKHGASYAGKNGKVLFWDHVVVKQLSGTGSNNITLLTSSLTYYPKKSFAHTNKPVIIKEPTSIMHAIGFNANLKKGTITFLSPVQGDYEKAQQTNTPPKQNNLFWPTRQKQK